MSTLVNDPPSAQQVNNASLSMARTHLAGMQPETVTNLLAVGAVGILQLGVAISLAPLIFSGPLSAGAARAGVGFVLGTAIVSLIVGQASKMSFVNAGAQNLAAVMIAGTAASIVASPRIGADELVPTVIVMVAITGLVTGLVFFIIGRFELSSLVRSLPFPVISGFAAGTGWLLFRGGIEVMHGDRVNLGDIDDLSRWSAAQFLVPGLVIAAIMLAVVNTRWLPNYLVSVVILGSVISFHIVGRAVSSFDKLEADGWFIGPFADGDGWAPIRPSDLSNTNWTALIESGPHIAAVVVVSVVNLLLNLSGLEGGPDPHIDMNSELRASGIANVVASLGGGLVGHHGFGGTVLGRQLGARGKIVPTLIAGMGALAFVLGPDLIAQVPRSVAGGVLAGLGVTLLTTWGRESLPSMSRTDQVLSGFILVAIAAFGILGGVTVGILVAAALFIVSYSRVDPVRHIYDAAGRSTTERSEDDAALLRSRYRAILAFELQGYLFFGSATGLRRQIEEQVVASATQFVIMNMTRVTALDSTAATGLKKLTKDLEVEGITTIWCGMRPDVAHKLTNGDDGVDRLSDLDGAIAWCEQQVLVRAPRAPFTFDGRNSSAIDRDVLVALDLKRHTVMAGETLFRAGANDCGVYFVEAGRFSTWMQSSDGRQVRIRQGLPGGVLGEVEFCTGELRATTVVADAISHVAVLDRHAFDHLAHADPKAAIALQQELLRHMGGRIDTTSALVRDLLR